MLDEGVRRDREVEVDVAVEIVDVDPMRGREGCESVGGGGAGSARVGALALREGGGRGGAEVLPMRF